MSTNGLKIRIIIGLVMAAFVYMKYLGTSQVNPITGEKQHISISPEQEVAMGLSSAPQMAAEFGGEVDDIRVQNYVSSVGNKLVKSTNAGKSAYQFQFHVLADPETINAFALPGGQIFITVGLLKRLVSDNQRVTDSRLAGVLGHEIGHVIGRHSAEQMAKQELTQGLVGATTMASGTMSGQQIASFVGNMIGMKYGREDELEADRFGVHYTQETGFDPEEMISVMEILKAAAGGHKQSEFMSTHPYPENRIVKIKEEISKLGANTGTNY